jgi:hypothetical protein
MSGALDSINLMGAFNNCIESSLMMNDSELSAFALIATAGALFSARVCLD